MEHAQITIRLLPDGRCRMASTCAGEFDSSYAPFDEAHLPAKVATLAAELRERLKLDQPALSGSAPGIVFVGLPSGGLWNPHGVKPVGNPAPQLRGVDIEPVAVQGV